MKVLKIKSNQTYINETSKKECHYFNYYIELDNGVRIQIRPSFKDDYSKLDTIAIYVK